MKTRTFLATIALVSAMIMTSCEKEDNAPNDMGAVKFTSGITATPVTKAAIDNNGNSVWEVGDPIGIFMVEHGKTTVAEGVNNYKYKATSAGTSTTFEANDRAAYYPMDESVKVDFIAYHPHNTSATNYVYPVNVASQASQTAIDLMTAKADNAGGGYTKADGRDNTTVNFSFTHQLVKLVMNVTKDTSVPGTIKTVSIDGMNTTASFDLTGAAGLTDTDNSTAITPFTVTAGRKYEAILLPVNALKEAHTVTFVTSNNESYVWTIKKDIEKFEAGKMYTYAINVTKYAVNATGSISKWEVTSTGNGTAE